MRPLDDTIAAIASPPGGAARGIVRVSGPAVERCLEACFATSRSGAFSPLLLGEGPGVRAESPRIIEGEVHLPGIHSSFPCDVYLWPAGRSYTGQCVAEFHTIGSPPLLEALLKALCAAGARLAEPGEFTLRAFLSGRIDLTQAEAVLGVIDAADRRQLETALAQLAGGLAGPLHRLRGELLELLTHLEAGFDFAEEDISFITGEELDRQIAAAIDHVGALLEKMSSRALTETAVTAVLVGRPNAGKSSLFNALAGSHALVSATPGTTRDYLSAELDLDGVKCRLIDTAGIGAISNATPECPLPDDDEIGAAAKSAAEEQHRQATIRVLCLDATAEPDEWERRPVEEADSRWCLAVLTKCDVEQVPNLSPAFGQVGTLSYVIATSSVTGEGLDALRTELRNRILALGNAEGDVVAGTAARCRDSLNGALECLRHARSLQKENAGEEFVAGEIRIALEELGRVVGAVYTDDVLDRIFSRFCVGK